MNMKKILMLGAVAASLAFTSLQDAQAASSNLDVEAQIIAAITIDCTLGDSLNFGTISPSSNGNPNTVVVTTAGVRSIAGTGNGALIGTTATAGECDVTGANGYNAVVTVPATINVIDGANTMAVGTFVINTPSGTGASPQTFALSGATQPVLIGGTLTVANNQAAGNYASTVAVTVNYQ